LPLSDLNPTVHPLLAFHTLVTHSTYIGDARLSETADAFGELLPTEVVVWATGLKLPPDAAAPIPNPGDRVPVDWLTKAAVETPADEAADACGAWQGREPRRRERADTATAKIELAVPGGLNCPRRAA
jgi:hypothetical protein